MKNVRMFLVVSLILLLIITGCSISNSSFKKLKGEWKVVKTELKKNDWYAFSYKMLVSSGDEIRFVDDETVNIGFYPLEYKITEDNVIKLTIEGATAIVFDYELKGDTLILENEYIRVEASKVN